MPSNTPRLDNVESRNYIINGAFDFWQRNTTVTTSSNGTYGADRWRNFKSGTGTFIQARDADTPTVAESGFKSLYSHLFQVSVVQSVSYSAGMIYCMEGYDYSNFHGRTARLQFWVKSSVAGQYSCCFNIESIARNYVVPYTINAANTWEQKSIDVTFESSSGVFLDNRRDLLIIWNLGTSSAPGTINQWQSGNISAAGDVQWSTNANATFKLAQVMLTPAIVPSGSILPFSRAGKTIGDELAMCQRYYEKSYPQDIFPGAVNDSGAVWSTMGPDISVSAPHYVSVRFAVMKRGTPIMTAYDVAGNINRLTRLGVATPSTSNITPSGGFDAPTNGGFAFVHNDLTTARNGYRFNWTAEAEL